MDVNTILIVGAGKGGRKLLELFYNQSDWRIVAVVDKKDDTQGLRLARQLNIPIAHDYESFLKMDIDLIFNVTKSEAVQHDLIRRKGENTEIVGGKAARFFWELREERIRNAGEGRLDGSAPEHFVVGNDPRMLELEEMIRKVAPTDSPVLIFGETGTGKEMVARAVHHLSSVADKPFVAINCTALPFNLFESEFFGHKKGAFTGAASDKLGLVEQADGGTLFLDEIGDLPLEMQVKLLRFLQSGEFRPVGSTEPRRVKVRILAATNRDLERAIAEERFRSDLFYRLSVFTLHLPALRERRGDIPLYAYQFLKQSMVRINKRVESISSAAMGALTAYDWPGNLRELQGVIDRAVILASHRQIDLEHLPFPMRGEVEQDDTLLSLAEARRQMLEVFERRMLKRYLQQAGQNVSKAAELAGMPRRTFYRLMQKLDIKKEKNVS